MASSPGPSAMTSDRASECARRSARGHVVASTTSSPAASTDRRRLAQTYVLDTSVLLADPGALSRFAEHEVVLPVVVITELEGKRHHPELGYFARYGAAHARRAARPARPARRAGADRRPGRHAAGRAQPHRPRRSLPAGFRLGDNDTRILAVALNLAKEGRLSRWSPRTCRCGSRRRRSGWPPRSTAPSWRHRVRLDRHGRARGHGRRRSTSCTTTGVVDLDEARDLPCHTGLVLLSERGTRAGPGAPDKRVRPGPRRPRGVRSARPLRRAAGRARPAARPRGRHRLARRPGRHRQVRAGAVRRARGGARAPPAQEGRRLPAAVRRRRPGARLPARQRDREDVALGAGGLRHPRRADQRATSSTRCWTAACSRCCR